MLLVASPSVCIGQETVDTARAPLATGKLVRVRMQGPRPVFRIGELTRITRDAIVVRPDLRTPEVEYPRDEIAELWVQNGERPGSKKGLRFGAKVGALGGAILGVAYAATTVESNCPFAQSCPTLSGRALTYGALGVGVGAGLGALVGSLIGRLGREPTWARAEFPKIGVALQPDGRKGVIVNLRW
jgi:hypothetical protein